MCFEFHSWRILTSTCSPSADKLGVLLTLLPVISKIGSAHFRRRVVELTPSKRVQDVKALVDVIDHYGHEILSKRRAALASGEEIHSEKVGGGQDIMTLLRKPPLRSNILCVKNLEFLPISVQANDSASSVDRLSEAEVVAQIK